jgi:phage RecT family recombinase
VPNNAVATLRPIDRFKQEISLRKDMMLPLLPKTLSFDKFEAMVIAAVGSNPKLLECDRASLLKACIQAAELGLSLNPTLGEGDILQVWDSRSKSYHAQFRPRYMGLMKLARQSGEIAKIEAEILREKDDYLIQKGDDPRLEHRVKLGDRGEKVGAYCIWTLKDGTKQFEVMDRAEILQIRERSSARTKDGKVVGPWLTDEDEMWRKTVVRRATKYMPRSTNAFDNAVTLDNLHEAGHEVDFEGGEIIDITEPVFVDEYEGEVDDRLEQEEEYVPPPPARKAAKSRMDDLAAKITPRVEVELLEPVDGDLAVWCDDAIEIVSSMPLAQKKEWRRAHKDLLDEAELMEPAACTPLIKILSKE